MSRRLDGFNNNFDGRRGNPVTDKQARIIEAIVYYLRIPDPNVTTSKQAWDFIQRYKERIEVRDFGIYIDGKLVRDNMGRLHNRVN